MNKNLQAKLYESYPNIFRQKDLSAQETAMCWGIACGAGWYNIVDVLCMHLKYLIDEPHKNIKMYTEWSNKASSKTEIKKYQRIRKAPWPKGFCPYNSRVSADSC